MMDAVYPGAPSALGRGRRVRGAGLRARHRTAPVTFAEIKEVDEQCEVEACQERSGGSGGAVARRRPDVLEEQFGRQFAECRRRRALRRGGGMLRESEQETAMGRDDSEPTALHQREAHT